MKLALPEKLPTAKITQVKETFLISKKLLTILWQKEKVLFILSLFSVLVPATLPFITAYVFKLIIDFAIKSISLNTVNYQALTPLLFILLGTLFFQKISFTLSGYVRKILFIKFPITLYQLVLDKISSLDLQYFEDSDFHDKLQRVKESYSWRPLEQINISFLLVQNIVQVTIALIATIRLNAFLAILLTLVSIPDLLNQVIVSKFSFNIWAKNTPARKKFSYLSNLIQHRGSIKELKIFSLRQKFISEVVRNQQDFFAENSAVAKKQLLFNSGLNILDSLVDLGIFIFIILEAVYKRITVGDISFYQNVINNYNNGIGSFFGNASRIYDHSLYNKDLFDVLEIEPKIKQTEKPIKVDFHKTPVIEFKDVFFRYPGSRKYILKNFSITINPGEKVAFVGENGAGKTTLIKLLSRFYDVDQGEILIDGVNIKNLDLESWYKSIGILFQDFIQYEYPAKDNIFFGKVWEKENLEKIIDASRSAGAHDMIKKFDNEYAQMLGKTFEGGIELSGGQWQKVALARAFFRNAPILVLDEPTAAIDAKAESEIFGRVEKLSKDKTVIIISHRFSTVRNADKIYVIENGQIIESGSHSELMKQSGQYSTLFNLQAKGYQ